MSTIVQVRVRTYATKELRFSSVLPHASSLWTLVEDCAHPRLAKTFEIVSPPPPGLYDGVDSGHNPT